MGRYHLQSLQAPELLAQPVLRGSASQSEWRVRKAGCGQLVGFEQNHRDRTLEHIDAIVD